MIILTRTRAAAIVIACGATNAVLAALFMHKIEDMQGHGTADALSASIIFALCMAALTAVLIASIYRRH